MSALLPVGHLCVKAGEHWRGDHDFAVAAAGALPRLYGPLLSPAVGADSGESQWARRQTPLTLHNAHFFQGE